jgi:hypothetical protein
VQLLYTPVLSYLTSKTLKKHHTRNCLFKDIEPTANENVRAVGILYFTTLRAQTYFHNKVGYFPKPVRAYYISTLRFAPASHAKTCSTLSILQNWKVLHCGAHQSYNVCGEFREIQLKGSKLEMGEHRTYTHTTWLSQKLTLLFYEGKYANKKGGDR